jgi:hypothetical protein
MKTFNHWRPLPHEIFFGLFLVITWIRLIFAAGFFDGDALFYLVLVIINVGVFWCCHSKDSPMRWRLGLLFYPLAMNAVFFEMKTAIPKIHPGQMDSLLQSIDAFGIGTNLSLCLEPFMHPVLTEFFSFCYLLFFPYLFFSLVYYFCGDLALLKKFVIGLFTIYGIGFLGYSFVPAAGPCFAMTAEFKVPLTGGWITEWSAPIIARGCNGADVFPSLHCAITSFFLFFDRRNNPWRFKLFLVPCTGLWVSTIYLRYHYFIDVLCGFALSAFALWLVNRYPRESGLKISTHNTDQLIVPSSIIL